MCVSIILDFLWGQFQFDSDTCIVLRADEMEGGRTDGRRYKLLGPGGPEGGLNMLHMFVFLGSIIICRLFLTLIVKSVNFKENHNNKILSVFGQYRHVTMLVSSRKRPAGLR
ncbi:hypothetical protein FKM82_010432 [Ascaphus truei]